MPIATALEIRDLRPDDWPEVAAIYTEGIRDDSTFASQAPTWKAWDASHSLRLVAVADDRVVGWAALSPVSTRHVYRGVARSAVYVRGDARGRGIGRSLMKALIARSEADGIWTLEASIFPENEASVRLHEAVGFRVVGVRERIGQRDGVWRDTVLLERRSEVISHGETHGSPVSPLLPPSSRPSRTSAPAGQSPAPPADGIDTLNVERRRNR